MPGVVIPGRGAKMALVVSPVDANAAVIFRMCVVFTSITITSMITSGRGFIQIGNQLFDQRHGVRFGAHDQSILRREAENLLHIHHGSQDGQHFLHFLRRGHIRQIENLHHLLGVFAPLGRIVDRHENRVRRKRLPEGFRDDRKLIQRLIERGARKIDRLRPDRLLLVVFRIEQDVDSRQFRHRLEQNPRRLVRHLQIDQIGIQRPQLRYRKQRIGPLLRALVGQFRRRQRLFFFRCAAAAAAPDCPPCSNSAGSSPACA